MTYSQYSLQILETNKYIKSNKQILKNYKILNKRISS